MKLLLGSNTFKSNSRQDIAVESWKHLKSIFPDNIDIVDVQFKGIEFNNHYNLKVLPSLLMYSKEYCDGDKELPIVQDILRVLHEHAKENGYTHWGFVNSDIIVMPNLMAYLKEKDISSMACSRIDISPISSLSQILNKEFSGNFRWEPAGFDLWVFNTDWFEKNKKDMLNDIMFLGMPEFDVLLTGQMMITDPTFELHNNYPPKIFHQMHQSTWVNKDIPEKQWNEDQIKNNRFNQLVYNIMYYHLQYNLCKRTPWGRFTDIPDGEKEFTKNYFHAMNLNVENIIHPV